MKTVGHFCGIPVVTNTNAIKIEKKSSRVHRHRRGQKLAYHLRVQKKWDKRFGTYEKRTPCMYRMNLNVVLGAAFNHGETLVVHPDLWDAITRDPSFRAAP